jgi:hypothetical protein
LSSDGRLAACRRQSQGAFKTKQDKNGAEFYLHKIGGPASSYDDLHGGTAPLAAAHEKADKETLNAVYSALLASLTLSKAHREKLHHRGLSDANIDERHYRTLPLQGRARLAKKLREQFGDVALSVPGIAQKQGENGPYLTVAGAAGLLIPIRSVSSRIVALMVRRDEQDGAGKYTYLSSAKYGGPSPGSPVHVPIGVTGPCETLRITEGALKSDIATSLSNTPTIGIPGASIWRVALEIVKQLGATRILLALDVDASHNSNVGRALAQLAEAITSIGYEIAMETWPVQHKGIDDALAAGAAIKVLTGGTAKEFIDDTYLESMANETPQDPDALHRVNEVLAEGGATAFFRDAPLLLTLAKIAETNPAEFAVCRARLNGAGVKLRDLDHALAPIRRNVRMANPRPDAGGQYRVSGGRIVRDVMTKDGILEVPLANWAGRIIEEVIVDDGGENRVMLAVEGALIDGTPLPRIEVGADEFPCMRWPVANWGVRAVVLAGMGTADHLRVALQLLSGDVSRRVVFAHTGWREIGGQWVFLHAGGALGALGPVERIQTVLVNDLQNLEFPKPPRGNDLIVAVRASLGLLSLGPDRIVFPGLSAVYGAILGGTDFSLHLMGQSGIFKTEWVALLQQHFGAGFDARHLPASWTSTGNALEGMAFAAKDVLLVVDDSCPTGSTADVQRMHREADRLLRGQGNHAGRQRMRADGSLRPTKYPRGLILSTGEDTPKGQSLRARLLVQEICKGDLGPQPPTPNTLLTACQRDGAAGLYAQCTAGFIVWLAPKYASIRAGLAKKQAEFRDKIAAGGQHARTAGIAAALAVGLRYFLSFAEETGAVSTEQAKALWMRGCNAFRDAAADQAINIAVADPTNQFLRLLRSILASGRGHLANCNGNEPENAAAWGWRQIEIGNNERWQAQGKRIGWIVDDQVYLEFEAAFVEVQELACGQGDSLAIAPRTLIKRLHEKGLLSATEERGGKLRLTVRRTLEGQRREAVSLSAESLFPQESGPSGPIDNQPAENTGLSRDTPSESAQHSVSEWLNWDTSRNGVGEKSDQKHGQKHDLGHLGHSKTVEETTPGKIRDQQQGEGCGVWE